jgi:predicted nucleic acid-binding protein
VKFWDSSAILPLLVREQMSQQVRTWWASDPAVFVWWGTEVECASALARLERETAVPVQQVTAAHSRLQQYSNIWYVVEPGNLLRDTAKRLLRAHPLRAADSLQLAAATMASRNQPTSLDFVCLDKRLCLAAQREGFNVITA